MQLLVKLNLLAVHSELLLTQFADVHTIVRLTPISCVLYELFLVEHTIQKNLVLRS